MSFFQCWALTDHRPTDFPVSVLLDLSAVTAIAAVHNEQAALVLIGDVWHKVLLDRQNWSEPDPFDAWLIELRNRWEKARLKIQNPMFVGAPLGK